MPLRGAGLDHLCGELLGGGEPERLTSSGTVAWSMRTKWSSKAATNSGRAIGASPKASRYSADHHAGGVLVHPAEPGAREHLIAGRHRGDAVFQRRDRATPCGR
jgi:hypothetical protein